MEDLQITIEGSAGSGKSSIAALIANALIEAEVEVIVADRDIVVAGLTEYSGPPQEQRLESLKRKGSVVTIQTVQAPRKSSED